MYTTCQWNAKGRDRTTGVCACVGTQRVSHVQWRQQAIRLAHRMHACRAVNQWLTTGKWHNTIYLAANMATSLTGKGPNSLG